MPVDLNTLFQSDPAAQELGLGFLGQEKEMNKAKLAQQLFETQKGQAMLPFDIANKKASTANTEAQTTGQNIQNQYDVGNMRTKLMQNYETMRKSMNDNDYEQIQRAAPAYKQTGEFLAQMPGIASHAAARKMLGNLYDPSFDQIPPNILGQVISMFGQTMEQMHTTDPEMTYKYSALGENNATKRYQADVSAEAKKQVAITAANSKIKQLDNELEKIREKAKTGSYAQQSGYYTDLAQQAAVQAAQSEEGPEKQALLKRAQVFSQIAEDAKNQEIQKAVAAAVEANRKAIDPNAIGQGQIRSVTPPVKGGPAQGTKENPIKLD